MGQADSLNTPPPRHNTGDTMKSESITGKLRARLSNATPPCESVWYEQAADDFKRLRPYFEQAHSSRFKQGLPMPNDVLYLLEAIENWMSEYKQASTYNVNPETLTFEEWQRMEKSPASIDLFAMCYEWREMILEYYPPMIEHTPEHANSLDQIAYGEWLQEHRDEIAQTLADRDEAFRAYDEVKADGSQQQQETRQPTASTPAPRVQLPPGMKYNRVLGYVLQLAESEGMIRQTGSTYSPGNVSGQPLTNRDLCYLIARVFCGDAVTRGGKQWEKGKGRFPQKDAATLFGFANPLQIGQPRHDASKIPPQHYKEINAIFERAKKIEQDERTKSE